MDNGPIAKSHVFQQVMSYLDVEVKVYLPQGKDSRRVAARSTGKVERPFRTVKEMHETLYHFHEPKDEEEANAWLLNFLIRSRDTEVLRLRGRNIPVPLSLFRLRISHSRRRSYYLTEYIGRMAPERTKRLIADVQAWCVKHKRKQTELAPHTNTQASAP